MIGYVSTEGANPNKITLDPHRTISGVEVHPDLLPLTVKDVSQPQEAPPEGVTR
jgi:hypothetical protein